ncbi:MAG: XdhC family protein [Chloroflexota bacterium]
MLYERAQTLYDVAEEIVGWQAAGKQVVLARVATIQGFGSRTDGAVMALNESGVHRGTLLSGAADDTLRREWLALLGDRAAQARTFKVTIGDDDAIEAGLGCGGSAQIVLQRARALPPPVWAAVEQGRRLALVSGLSGEGCVLLNEDEEAVGQLAGGDLAEAGLARARELLGRARTCAEVVAQGGGQLLVEVFVPQVHLLVVGQASLAEALAAQARLLRWRSSTVDGLAAAQAPLGELRACDALVLLTHDKAVDAQMLASALRRGVGYVGALGSRTTQAGRRERLTTLGVDDALIARLHGPVGLDIGAATPEETAVSIVAEILASLSSRAATPLTSSSAPIHG